MRLKYPDSGIANSLRLEEQRGHFSKLREIAGRNGGNSRGREEFHKAAEVHAFPSTALCNAPRIAASKNKGTKRDAEWILMTKARLGLGLGRLGAASHVALGTIIYFLSFVDEIAIRNAEHKMQFILIAIRTNFN